MREKYEWGPSQWPMHWCDVVERKVIDCGAHAAMAHEAFTPAGSLLSVPSSFSATAPTPPISGRSKWGDEQVSDHWIDDDLIYHEGNALLVGEDEVKLWDSSAGWWINPRQAGGYGSLVAVRIFAEGPWGGGDGFRWGEHRIKPNEWHQL
jgi:hypothetical protein